MVIGSNQLQQLCLDDIFAVAVFSFLQWQMNAKCSAPC
jgi:hypothetical protein